MLSLRVLGLAMLTLTTVVYGGCLQDFQAIDGQVLKLGQQADALTSGQCGQNFISLANTFQNLTRAVNTATNNAKAASTPTVSEATTCYNYLCGTLVRDTQSTLQKLINKKSYFATCGLTPTFKNQLTNLKTALDNLLAEYIRLAPTPTIKSNLQACKSRYDTALSQAITAFS